MNELINTIAAIFMDPRLTASLLSIAIKSTIIFILAGAIWGLMRRKSAAASSLILTIVFAAALILPLLIFVIPSWQLPLAGLFSSSQQTGASTSYGAIIQITRGVFDNGYSFSALFIFELIWTVGAIVLLIRLLCGWLTMFKIARHAVPTNNSAIIELTHRLKSKFELHQNTIPTFSPDVLFPQVFGVFKQKLILPESASQWPIKKLEVTITHELGHIKRHDALRHLMASAAVALYWFNPLVWIYRRKLINDAEIICDNFVLINGNDPLTYAEILLGLARQIRQKRLTAPVGANIIRKSELEGRLMSIMSNNNRHTAVRQSAFVLGVLLTLVFVLPLAGVQLLAVESGNSAPTASVFNANGHFALYAQKDSGEYPAPDDFVKVTVMPEMIKMVQPEYPDEAKNKMIGGTVYVKALVDKDGSVVKAQLAKTSGNDLLDTAAVNSAYKCKYTPAEYDGKPVAIWVTYSVNFNPEDQKYKEEIEKKKKER